MHSFTFMLIINTSEKNSVSFIIPFMRLWAKTFLYILYYRYGDNLGVDKYPIFALYNICLTQYTLSHCRVLVQRTFRICLIAGTLREAVFVVHSVRQSLTFIILASTSELLYVQEVVTLQKKYQIYLQQKMRFTPFFDYYDILGWILFVYRTK